LFDKWRRVAFLQAFGSLLDQGPVIGVHQLPDGLADQVLRAVGRE
jgi:hypothetical protein